MAEKNDSLELTKKEIPEDEKRWLELLMGDCSAREACRQIYPNLSELQIKHKAKNLGVKYRNYVEKIQNRVKGEVTDGIISLAPRALEVQGEIMNDGSVSPKVRADIADKILNYTGWITKESKLTVVHEYRRLLEEVGLADVVDAEFSVKEDGEPK